MNLRSKDKWWKFMKKINVLIQWWVAIKWDLNFYQKGRKKKWAPKLGVEQQMAIQEAVSVKVADWSLSWSSGLGN